MNVGELMVSLALNITDFDRKLDEAEAKGLTFTETLQSVFASADPKLDIQVKDGVAEVKIEDFRALVDSLPTEKTTTLNVDSGGSGSAGVVGVASGAGGGGDAGQAGAGLLGGLIMGVLPAITPLAAAATNAVMGLASAFTSAGSGVVGFGAVTISNLKTVFTASSDLTKAQEAYNNAVTDKQRQAALIKEAQALHGLNAEQLKAVRSLQSFGQFWQHFSQSFQKPVFQVFELALSGIETVMRDMRPVITAAGNAFVTLFTEMDKALGTSDNQQFFQWLATTAGPAIISFGHATGNILRGVANLMMAFTGPAQTMESGLVGLTSAFYRWTDSLAQSKGFQQFLDYAAKSGQQVMTMLRNLLLLVGKLLVDMAPLGTIIMNVVNSLLKGTNALAKFNPLFMTLAAAGLSAFGTFKLLQPVLAAFFKFDKLVAVFTALKQAMFGLKEGEQAVAIGEALMDALNPVGWIVLGIAAVALLATTIYKYWTPISAWVTKEWDHISKFLTKAWKSISAEATKIWNEVTTFLSKTWKDITGGITSAWNGIVNFFKKYGVDILAGLTGPVGLLVLYLVKHWKQITTDASNAWKGLVSLITGVWKGFVKWLETAAKDMVQGVVKAFQWMYNHNYYFKDMVDFITRTFRETQKIVKQVWSDITGWLTKTWATISSEATKTWDAVSKFFTQLWNGMEKVAKAVWTTLSGWFKAFWDAEVRGWEKIWNTISKAVEAVWTDMVNAAKAVWTPIQKFFSNIWDGVSNTARRMWQTITGSVSSGAQSAYHGVTGVFDKLGSYFSNLWSEAFNWGANIVSSIATGIESMVHKVETAAKNVAYAISSFLGFHSPAEKGPGSTADTWMPNLMNMLTYGIKSGVPNVHAALSGVFSVPALGGTGGLPNLNTSLGIGSPNATTRPIIVYLDGREVARGTAPHLVDEIRLETGLRM